MLDYKQITFEQAADMAEAIAIIFHDDALKAQTQAARAEVAATKQKSAAFLAEVEQQAPAMAASLAAAFASALNS